MHRARAMPALLAGSLLLVTWFPSPPVLAGPNNFTNLDGDVVNVVEAGPLEICDQGTLATFDYPVDVTLGDRLTVELLTNGHDCCTDNGTAGCEDPPIEACVCAQDPFCCSNSWDYLCAAGVTDYGCSNACPDDYLGDRIEIDQNGANGGHPDISVGPNAICGNNQVCFKAAVIGTLSSGLAGTNGRRALHVIFTDLAAAGAGDPQVSALLNSIGYRHAERTFVDRTKTLRFSFRPGGGAAVDDRPLVTANVEAGDLLPDLFTNATLVLSEGAESTITSSHLHAFDADSPASDIVYSLLTEPESGVVRVSASPALTFTQAQVNSGFVSYAHGGGEAPADGFDFTVASNDCCSAHLSPACSDALISECVCASDPLCCSGHWFQGCADLVQSLSCGLCPTPEEFSIVVSPVNDPPELEVNQALVLGELGSKALGIGNLAVSDNDNTSTDIIFVLQNLPDYGELLLDDTPLGLSPNDNVFTQEELEAGLVRYRNMQFPPPLGDAFEFKFGDGSAPLSSTQMFNILVLPNFLFGTSFEEE